MCECWPDLVSCGKLNFLRTSPWSRAGLLRREPSAALLLGSAASATVAWICRRGLVQSARTCPVLLLVWRVPENALSRAVDDIAREAPRWQ